MSSPVIQHSLICLDDQPLLIEPVLIIYKLLEFILRFPLNLVSLLFDLSLHLVDGDPSRSTYRIEFTLKLCQMTLNRFDCLLRFVALDLYTILLIVVGVVTRVKHVIFDGVRVVSQGLQVVGTNEPLRLSVLGWQGAHNVLLIVVSGKVQWIRGCDITIEKRVVLDDTELFAGIKNIALGVLEELFIWRRLILSLFFLKSSLLFGFFFFLIKVSACISMADVTNCVAIRIYTEELKVFIDLIINGNRLYKSTT